jgi:hypothetical protein
VGRRAAIPAPAAALAVLLAACAGDAPTRIEPPRFDACWSEARADGAREAARRHCAAHGRDARLEAVVGWFACGAQGAEHRATFACVPP